MTEHLNEDGKDVAEGQPTVRSAYEVRLVRVVLVLLLICCLGNVLLPEWVQGPGWHQPVLWTLSGNEIVGGLLIGTLLSQFATLSVWGVMSSWPWHFRWLLMGILTFALVNMFAVGLQGAESGEIPLMGFVVMVLGGWGITFGSALIFGWLLRRYRVVAGKSELVAAYPQAKSALSQYGVRFLLMVMVSVALGSFILRNTLPKNSDMWVSGLQFVSIAMFFVWLTIGVSILTFLEFRVCMGHCTLATMGLLFLCLTLGPIVFQAVSVWIFGLWDNGFFNMSLTWDLIVFACPQMLGLFLGNLIAFLPTRWIGFRLVRTSGGEAALRVAASKSDSDTDVS
jgi:hypothetical protein